MILLSGDSPEVPIGGKPTGDRSQYNAQNKREMAIHLPPELAIAVRMDATDDGGKCPPSVYSAGTTDT
jgi:hypothetical protein